MKDEIEKISFSDENWETPKSNLNSAKEYCDCCLINENSGPSSEWVKDKCHLPVRKTPGGPIFRAALRNASARLSQTNASAESKAKAKKRLISLMHSAGIETSMDKSEDEVDTDCQTTILKYDEEKRLVYAVAYPLMPKGKSDTQNDRIEADELEKASHNWLVKSRKYDLHHKELNVPSDSAVVVESYIAPVDINYPLLDGNTKLITKGSWVVVTHFPDLEMWQKIRNKEFGAYSIRGKAKRISITK